MGRVPGVRSGAQGGRRGFQAYGPGAPSPRSPWKPRCPRFQPRVGGRLSPQGERGRANYFWALSLSSKDSPASILPTPEALNQGSSFQSCQISVSLKRFFILSFPRFPFEELNSVLIKTDETKKKKKTDETCRFRNSA